MLITDAQVREVGDPVRRPSKILAKSKVKDKAGSGDERRVSAAAVFLLAMWRRESGFERVVRHQDRGLGRQNGMQSAAHTQRALRVIIILSPLQIYRTSTRDVTARRRFDQQQPLTCRSNTTITVAPTSARSTLAMYSLLLPSPCMEPRQRTAFSFTTTSPMVSSLMPPLQSHSFRSACPAASLPGSGRTLRV